MTIANEALAVRRAPPSKVPWREFWLWLMAALAIRTGTAILLSTKLEVLKKAGFASNGINYYEPIVTNLLSGNGFALQPGHPTAGRPPVYPLLLAGVRTVLGSPQWSVLVLQAMAGALVVGLIFLLASLLLGRRAGYLSAALGIVSPDLVAYSLFNLSDMTNLALFLVGSVLVLVTMRSGGWLCAVLLGLVLGLGALTKEMAACLILVWPVVLVFQRDPGGRRRLKAAGLILAVALLTLVPWWVRNWMVFHEVVLLTTTGSANFYQGTVIHSRPYTGGYTYTEIGRGWSTREREAEVAERIRETRTRHDRDRAFIEAAAENIRSDPWGQVVHMGRKFLFLWSPVVGPRHAARAGWAAVLWAVAVWYYCLLTLALVGFWCLRKSREIVAVLMPPVVYQTVVPLFIGSAEPRYHLLAVPALLMATSFVLTSWRRRRL